MLSLETIEQILGYILFGLTEVIMLLGLINASRKKHYIIMLIYCIFLIGLPVSVIVTTITQDTKTGIMIVNFIALIFAIVFTSSKEDSVNDDKEETDSNKEDSVQNKQETKAGDNNQEVETDNSQEVTAEDTQEKLIESNQEESISIRKNE